MSWNVELNRISQIDSFSPHFVICLNAQDTRKVDSLHFLVIWKFEWAKKSGGCGKSLVEWDDSLSCQILSNPPCTRIDQGQESWNPPLLRVYRSCSHNPAHIHLLESLFSTSIRSLDLDSISGDRFWRICVYNLIASHPCGRGASAFSPSYPDEPRQ